MTSLFDRIRQRRGQAAPPDTPLGPPADSPVPEAPTEVQPAPDPIAGAPTTPDPSDLTVIQPATAPASSTSTADAPTDGDHAAAAVENGTALQDAPESDEVVGESAPPTSDPNGPDGPPTEVDGPPTEPRSLADQAALAAELPDAIPSRAQKATSGAPGLTPLIPTGDPAATPPEAAAPDAVPGPPVVPQPPVLGPPTSGGTPAAAPPTPPVAVPADPALPAETPKVTIRNRGRMRRRLRYLRRVRELGYRDLGGLVFELRRAHATNQVLVDAKVDALRRIDAELHALEHGLRDYRTVEELHEPGVSVCIRCGALHGSDANYCPQCGVSVTTPVATVTAATPATVDGGTPQPEAPAPAADPRPRAAATPANGETNGAPATNGETTPDPNGTESPAGSTPESPNGEPTVVLDDASTSPESTPDTTADER